ncbi:MAG: hypothetical protein SXA11_09875 [Cyanobacteriota bacterium]|nr:hypothetical protein [Cyanobacteriota bacterium]
MSHPSAIAFIDYSFSASMAIPCLACGTILIYGRAPQAIVHYPIPSGVVWRT